MKLSVSNIAWGKNNFSEFLSILKNNKCDGVEIAPSLIWEEPTEISPQEIIEFKKNLNSFNLELVGFHSLLYTKPELELFKNNNLRRQTIDYIFKLIKLCNDLGGKKLIFGSPKNRRLNGRTYEECFQQSISDFREIAKFSKKYKIYFCIEPLSKNISEFIQSVKEGIEIVESVNEEHFKLHIDTKTLFHTKEDLKAIIKNKTHLVEHVHVSDDNLNPPGTINFNHEITGKILKKINYNKYVSIEMLTNKESHKQEKIKVIENSISFVKKRYF